MPPKPAWFTVAVKDAPGNLRIRGEWAGGHFWDDSRPYNIRVEAEGLRIETEKSFDPKLIEEFVQQFGALEGVAGDQTISLRSAIVADFDLSVLSRRGVCRLTFKLRHGNSKQWNVVFMVDTDLSDVQVELGADQLQDEEDGG